MAEQGKKMQKRVVASSPKFEPYKESKNNNNNSASDEQLAKDLFATPKPSVIIDNTTPKTPLQPQLATASTSSSPPRNLLDPNEYVEVDDDKMEYENLN